MRELSGAARAHFDQPRHVGALDVDAPNVATARVGEPASGAILQLHLRIGADGSITAARFKAYGCGWLIACGSLLVERLQGRTLKQAARLRHHELVETLDVPPEKLYCAVLAETALKKALRACPAQPTPPVAIQSDHL
ncbi:MAG: iron-sulfur cluster assembly scaffold protein [Candidatus Contendobacter sp.]|nr:iron-sulfur cluster assembly scaffold protein [Candidatus Contendobacter sp.]MDS4057211.1 iron-sulfur cluster assembly scaffold protein [Candidatus Contendobacter sp.]